MTACKHFFCCEAWLKKNSREMPQKWVIEKCADLADLANLYENKAENKKKALGGMRSLVQSDSTWCNTRSASDMRHHLSAAKISRAVTVRDALTVTPTYLRTFENIRFQNVSQEFRSRDLIGKLNPPKWIMKLFGKNQKSSKFSKSTKFSISKLCNNC